MDNAGACGALYTHFLLLFKNARGIRELVVGVYLGKKNGGELGHDNVLAALNN